MFAAGLAVVRGEEFFMSPKERAQRGLHTGRIERQWLTLFWSAPKCEARKP